VSIMPLLNKTCVVCQKDVALSPRVKDPKGQYYCEPCHTRLSARRSARQGGAKPASAQPMTAPRTAATPVPTHPPAAPVAIPPVSTQPLVARQAPMIPEPAVTVAPPSTRTTPESTFSLVDEHAAVNPPPVTPVARQQPAASQPAQPDSAEYLLASLHSLPAAQPSPAPLTPPPISLRMVVEDESAKGGRWWWPFGGKSDTPRQL